MNNKLIPSPFVTGGMIESMNEKKKLMASIPSLSVAFIETPLETTVMSRKFQGQMKHAILHELRYRAEQGEGMAKPIMTLVIERGSLAGELDEIKSALVVYSPETNSMLTLRVGGHWLA